MEQTVFTERLNNLSKEMSDFLESFEDGKDRAILILASESSEEKGHRRNIISVQGNGGAALNVLADFATNPQTKELFKATMALMFLKRATDGK